MSNSLTEVGQKAKSFWDTKEGTTGMIIGLGILGAIGYGAYKIMPYIANLLENTFYAVLFGLLVVGLIYAFVIDGTLRSRLWLMYKMLMRALTYSIIKYDPIGVLREIQKKAKERLKLVDDSRGTVRGQVRQIEQAVQSFQTDSNKIMKTLEMQRRNNAPAPEIQNNLTKLGRLDDAKKRLEKSLQQTQGFYTQLTRAYTALETIDENINFEISIMEREYKAVNASHAAWKAVKAAFKGSDQIDMLRNDTLAFLAEDYGNKLGEIETFMEDSKKFIDSVDLQNAMHAEDGLRVLDELNSRNLEVVQSKSLANNPSPVLTPSYNATTVDYSVLNK